MIAYYLYAFFEGFVPIYPVYMILFESRGYGYMDISLLLMIWSIPVVLLEVPSGILADRWSRKGVLSLGMAFKACGFLLWWLSPTFWAAAAGFVLWGAQEAFCSGSRQALLYETLRERGAEGRYELVSGRANALTLAGTAIAMVVGAALYAVDASLALLLSALFPLACAFIALRFRGSVPREAGLEPALFASFGQTLKATRPLALFIAATALAAGAAGLADEYDGLWAKTRYAIPVSFIGVWSAFRFGVQGVGSLAAGGISRLTRGGGGVRMAALLSLTGLLFVLSAVIPGLSGAIPYLSFFFLMSGLQITIEARLQKASDDAGRATILSLSSLVMTLTATILAPLFGLVSEVSGLPGLIALAGGCVCVAGFAFLADRRLSWRFGS